MRHYDALGPEFMLDWAGWGCKERPKQHETHDCQGTKQKEDDSVPWHDPKRDSWK